VRKALLDAGWAVLYEQAEDGGWSAFLLTDLPGVVALGATREEVSEGIKKRVTCNERVAGSSPPAGSGK
jgi:hypothetical protein